MKNRLPPRFWVGTIFAASNAVVLAMTLAWPDWIERNFGLEPDDGDGSAERGWAIAFAVATVIFFTDAVRFWWKAVRPPIA